jgi:hypothetical protein
MKELTEAEKCRKNNWKVGDVLKATSFYGERQNKFILITAIGETKVLGRQVMLPPETTAGEECLDFSDNEYTWRLTPYQIKTS